MEGGKQESVEGKEGVRKGEIEVAFELQNEIDREMSHSKKDGWTFL